MTLHDAPGGLQELEADFPGWHFYDCVAGHHHAACPGSPRIDVHASTVIELRDEISLAEIKRLAGYWRLEMAERRGEEADLGQREAEQSRFIGRLPASL